MDEYCKAHKNNDYCHKINQYVTNGFCQMACKGQWKKYYSLPLDELRANNRKPLTEEEKNNQELVSVVIPYVEHDNQYLQRTLKSVQFNAIGPIEIILSYDSNDEGMRVMTNRGVERATGKYILRLDCHTAMSPEWDARMKASCVGDVIVKPMLDTLDEKTWKGIGRDMGFISLDPELRNAHILQWKILGSREIEEDTLSILGCCFMMTKEYYQRQGGCDESLGIWGALGLEWSFKTWLTGGHVLIRTDTVCHHLFRFDKPFTRNDNELNEVFRSLGRKWRDGLGEGQTKPLAWLFDKFSKYLTIGTRVAPREQRTPALCANDSQKPDCA